MSQADLEQLARWRAVGARRSEEVVELATRVLKSSKTGDQEWAIREQLAIAALDIGRLGLANEQISLLSSKFPKSPRVSILQGLRLEAQNDMDSARKVYQGLLKIDETNISAHQRLISLSLSTPQTAIPLLLTYLDTFYSDAAGWSLLADLYAELGLYAQSLSALGHVMLLQTWDSDAVCRAGEIAYTWGDYYKALKHFLRAAEMETDITTKQPGGKSRSWWGVRQATKRLLEGATTDFSTVSSDSRPSLKQIQSLSELATERLLALGGSDLDIRRKVLAGGNETVR
ncbi:hypothetical protein BCR39DRAFT_526840 [Naematelia encephala]|uniref:ER membrane protein complex subunit 2 n=1 Tax=Naematelia encephala TaxID=71784 RepID=A0A1Y2B8X4_9TREE|nr:hypothetical protein BCR39DRAFT_526840 [Naematelia encephala]